MANLTQAAVSFHTNDDDKDDDTYLLLILRKPDGTEVGRIGGSTFGIWGHFDNNTNNGPFNIPINIPYAPTDVAGSTLVVNIQPNGHDTWKFDCFIKLTFSDGTTHADSFLNHWLSQNNKENDYTLT